MSIAKLNSFAKDSCQSMKPQIPFFSYSRTWHICDIAASWSLSLYQDESGKLFDVTSSVNWSPVIRSNLYKPTNRSWHKEITIACHGLHQVLYWKCIFQMLLNVLILDWHAGCLCHLCPALMSAEINSFYQSKYSIKCPAITILQFPVFLLYDLLIY